MGSFNNSQYIHNWPQGVGIVANDADGLNSIDKFGYNDTIGSSAYETIWDGGATYAHPPSALAMTVTSDEGGTDNGVQVTVEGLDDDGYVVTQEVTLNASGTATTTQTFERVYRAYVSGSTGATGDISVTNSGIVYALIKAEFQQTMMAVYTVPTGKRAFLIAANISIEKNQDIVAKLMLRRPGGVFRAAGLVTSFGVPFQRVWQFPPILEAGTDIEIRAKAGATTGIAAGFELLLEDL